MALVCAVIDIPDYTFEEKKIIFTKFAMPKVLKRIGLREEECVVTDAGLDAVIHQFENTTGIRDIEQAAEHLAANALYQVEVEHAGHVVFDAAQVRTNNFVGFGDTILKRFVVSLLVNSKGV